ncbi:MAG: hypothetical protein AAFY77_04750 [Pseudomonadota bacterium]
MAAARPTIAYLIEPRFPGGTSAAVAQELAVAKTLGDVRVHAVSSAMFPGRAVAPVLEDALDRLGLSLIWDAPEISADAVILHNPAFLKFDTALATRVLTKHLIVVTHENFVRPGGAEGFDVRHCLDLIDRASLALQKSLAPISAHNRDTVQSWLSRHPQARWGVLPEDWHNICDFELTAPTDAPRDRRGRHSRPGFEKFPPLDVLDACFPATAEANVLLGADLLLPDGSIRPHWTMFPFQGVEVERYFEMIDFMVYFTGSTWRESFGRVLAEGIAAGKLVISDPQTAATFHGAVVEATPDQVDGIIAGYLREPARYVADVTRAQKALGRFAPTSFRDVLGRALWMDAQGAA